MRNRSMILLAIALATLSSLARAQITVMEEYHGRTIGCSRSGLRGAYTFCGLDKTLRYSSIFVGTIIDVAPLDNGDIGEFRLLIEPKEIFLGSPPETVTVRTQGGECIDHDDELRAGDQWLFYLQPDQKTGLPILWFGTPSGPVDKSERQLSLLRLQKANPDKGLITGNVTRFEDEFNETGINGHTVRIKRKSDGAEQTTASGPTGYFRFPPLSPGDYDLSGNTVSGLWAEPVTVDVHPSSCAEVPVELAPDAIISGHVFDRDGKPVGDAPVEVTPFQGPLGAGDALTAADGSYEIHGLPPGTYYVGIGVRDPKDSSFTFYYPSGAAQESAIPITVRGNEHKKNVDLHLTRPLPDPGEPTMAKPF